MEENKNHSFWHEVNRVHIWSYLLFKFPSVLQCHKQGKQHYWVNQGLEILTLLWNYDVKLPTALGWSQPTLPLQCRWHGFSHASYHVCMLSTCSAPPTERAGLVLCLYMLLRQSLMSCLGIFGKPPLSLQNPIGKSPHGQVSGAHWGRQAPSHSSPLLDGKTKGSAPGCFSTDVYPMCLTQSGCREAPKHQPGRPRTVALHWPYNGSYL